MGKAEKEGLVKLRDIAFMEQMIRGVGDSIIEQDLRRIALMRVNRLMKCGIRF